MDSIDIGMYLDESVDLLVPSLWARTAMTAMAARLTNFMVASRETQLMKQSKEVDGIGNRGRVADDGRWIDGSLRNEWLERRCWRGSRGVCVSGESCV